MPGSHLHSNTNLSADSHKVKIGNYYLGATLGSGTFGKVKLGVHELTNQKVAIKMVNRAKVKSLDVASKLRREIELLRSFRHPHIIKLYQVISTPTDVFLIMEHVDGGELFDHIVKKSKLPEQEARRFFQQILSGVDYCHRHMVVHRDLKPENLLLDKQGTVKIADFGLSNMMIDGEFLQTSCGSPNYAAPEVVSGKLYAGPEVDIWSCGIILYALLCGSLPFDDEHIPTLFKKIRSGLFVIPTFVSLGAANLLKMILQVDPMKRATIEQIRNTDWFKEELPAYLFPPDCGVEASVIDKKILATVCERCEVSEREVLQALLCGDPHDSLAVCYHLLMDAKLTKNSMRNGNDHSDAYKAFYLASSPPPAGSPLSGNSLQHAHPEHIPAVYFTKSLEPVKGNAPPKAKWHLGIRSQSKPLDIMHELYKALARSGFEWKVVNDFHIRARKESTSKEQVLVEIQLYQVDKDRSYLVDFRLSEALTPCPQSCHQSLAELHEADSMEFDDVLLPLPNLPSSHVLLFLEFAADIIASLARH